MAIQERFRDRMGKDLHLLSISVDPTRDTVATLKAFARRNGAGPGWYFLTGRKENVELALHKFGQKVDSPDNHSNLFMVGNDATGLWKKAMGLAPAEDLIQVIASVLDDPGPN
jgi:cytochrome oxidase Cu insertion factor (SCO1/SenC/PrrC family)